MTESAAKFIVRIQGYPQKTDYPEFCNRFLSTLKAENPPDFSAFMSTASRLLKEYQGEQSGWGKIRTDSDYEDERIMLMLKGKYAPSFERVVSRVCESPEQDSGDAFIRDIKYDHKGQTVCLATVQRSLGEGMRFEGRINKYEPERNAIITEALSDLYDKAIKGNCDAAVEFYSVFSHLMPFHRGSAAAGHLALEYLLNKAGQSLPYLKEGIDLNLEAMLMSPEEFRSRFNSGVYFEKEQSQASDMEASVLAWQKKEMDNQHTPPLSADHFLNEVRAVAENRAFISSGFRYAVKQLVDAPHGPVITIDNRDRLKFIRFSDEDKYRLAYEFIDAHLPNPEDKTRYGDDQLDEVKGNLIKAMTRKRQDIALY